MSIYGIRLHDNESIVHVERMALVPFLPRIVAGILLIVLPFFVFFPLVAFGAIGLIILMLVAGFGAFLVVAVAVRWRKTVCVLTTQRVLFVEQRGLLDRAVTEASARTIQDVAYRTFGLMGRLLRIGTVRIVFRGVVPDMVLSPVIQPDRLTRLIHELRDVPAQPTGDGTFSRKHLKESAS